MKSGTEEIKALKLDRNEKSYFESLRQKINRNKSSRQGSPVTKGFISQNSASKSDKFSTPLQAIWFDSNATSPAKKIKQHCEYGEISRRKTSPDI